ncbi:DUF1559 domain-containing protein [Paludisphaera borealis]|nr:DUF1559 domain-containing protein [Paludisphaera borealis]
MRTFTRSTRRETINSVGFAFWLVLAVVTFTAAGWLTWAAGQAREAARSAQCVGNFKQVGLALLNYESTYGSLPPAYVADAQGKPLHSWRVLLLPFLGQDSLYAKIRFDEPWDSPNNRELHAMRPSTFFCPSGPEAAEHGFTSILAVVGPRTLFPGSGVPGRLTDIRDDPESTLMLVESDNAAIHWMEPRDLVWGDMSFRVNDRSRPNISSKHALGEHRGAHVATAADGMASLPDDRPPGDIKAMLLIDDGTKVDLPLGIRRD